MSEKSTGGPPWPVWAIVTILVALIGAIATIKSRQATAPPAGQPAANPPESQPATVTDFSTRIGVYSGSSVNKARYRKGLATLDIRTIERPYGKVRTQLAWSQGLSGEGSLFGNIDKEGLMSLSGTILSDVSGTWDADLNCNFRGTAQIACTYRLYPKSGNANGTQDGEFVVDKTNSTST